LRKKFFESVLKTDIQSFTEEGTSLMWTRFVQDIPYLSFALAAFYGRAIGEPLKIIACLALAAWINWPLLVFSLIVTPIALLLISGLGRKMKAHTIDSYAQDASTNTLVFELMQGLSTVQAYTMEQAERLKFRDAAQRCWNMGLRVVMFRALSKPAVELLGITFICMGVIAGAHLVLHRETHLFGIRISDNALEVEGLLVFFGTLVGMYDPLRKLGEVLPQIQMGLASADRLFPVLDALPRIVEPAQPKSIAKPHQTLGFENIHFQYNRSRPVLQGIDLSIPFGETVAIVGPNGCGKTTLANLLPRFFDPVQGRVTLDGVDLREIGLGDLRRRIGLVTQQTHLFDDTVANNIRYGSPDATDAQIIAAAEQAHAHEFIVQQLPNGYETMVGQAGCRLSGGQRQRVALARAILRNPEILILDEPTSQIDLQSESLIQDVLQRFVVGRTAIMITHRLALLAVAHRVIVMQGGKVLDVGRHEELLQRCPLYRQLHQLDQEPTAKAA
jgi:ATP-binding cassette subfamily B protein/subfamily B ATP-binding cassette protein MsbA